MNFELKPLTLVGVASEKCDALIVLVSTGFQSAKDDLSLLVAQALKSGDLEDKPGKLLPMYRPLQVHTARMVLAHVGDASPRSSPLWDWSRLQG